MNSYPKAVLVMVLVVACTAFVMEFLHRSPLFTESGLAGARSVGPARYTFDALLDAIEWVESEGDPWAVGKKGEIGAYQINKIFLDDVNRILLKRFATFSWSECIFHEKDRYDKQKSREMVSIYLTYYGGTFEEMARKVNGGPAGHLKESTKAYWEKVQVRLMVKEIR